MATVEIRRGPTGLRVLLQRSEDAEVEELTEEQAHALMEAEDPACPNKKGECWWCALALAMEGLR